MRAMLFAIGAGLCWGIGELFTRSVLHTGKIGPLASIAVRSTIALPLLWLAYAIAVRQSMASEPTTWLRAEPTILAKLALGSGIIAGGAGMIFFYTALSLGEISRVKPVAFTVAPATAVLLGWLVLGEPISARKLVAIGLVICGLVLLTGK